jgi:uncharacterized protein with von Willebrand factor type A (vWA) domain
MSGADSSLPDHIAQFGRILRSAGLSIGVSSIHEAITAAALVGPERREDFYWALRSAFVKRREAAVIFDQAFALLWSRPREPTPSLADAPARRNKDTIESRTIARRLQDALVAPRALPPRGRDTTAMAQFATAAENIARQDFATMSAAETQAALAALRRLALPHDTRRTRRLEASRRGPSIDWRGTLRRSLRTGGTPIALPRRRPQMRPQPLVLLIDISGSMEPYARIFLGFAHALMRNRRDVFVFLFGTRLSNVTRLLRHRDVDEALARTGSHVTDWAGGTRIGENLARFNRRWSRRVLSAGGQVLLLSDGLERGDSETLAAAAARLQRNCDRLIWLNPLLRYAGFAPKAAGVRAILPFVDAFRPVHNLASIADLVDALNQGV